MLEKVQDFYINPYRLSVYNKFENLRFLNTIVLLQLNHKATKFFACDIIIKMNPLIFFFFF